jgi:hypothetical protein
VVFSGRVQRGRSVVRDPQSILAESDRSITAAD